MNIALSCGVNDYGYESLRGCLNDVDNLRYKLTSLGWAPRIKVLKDKSATKESILFNLEAMVVGALEGDHLVFHFSGHGSQVPDQDGDEPDALDEVLCCYGMDFLDSRTFIRDDELRKILVRLPDKATIDIFLDCCHSGTGVRDGSAKPRYFPIPVTLAHSWHPRHLLKDIQQPNVALWAGCKSDQTSADAYIGGKYQGAFTHYLTEAIQALHRHGATMRHEVLRQLLMDIKEYEQTPQLECTDEMKDREIFT